MPDFALNPPRLGQNPSLGAGSPIYRPGPCLLPWAASGPTAATPQHFQGPRAANIFNAICPHPMAAPPQTGAA